MQVTTDALAPVIADSYAKLAEALKKTGIPLHRAMIVGDANTLPLYGMPLREAVADVFSEVHSYAFPAGEEHKNLGEIEKLLSVLMEYRYDRKDCVLALGGGVVGDMAGFAASVYLRGVPVVQLPTTLLAQIDSSIGGKTGVDFKGYKNMVGAFHMPALVYANTEALRTLPAEQFAAGMGEVVKSALLLDGDFYLWLKENAEKIRGRDRAALREMIRRTAGIKVEVVRQNPTEKGVRALLNLGHTVGHAIEKSMNFTMLHGCCVAVGLVAAAAISRSRGLISEADYEDIRETLRLFDLPLSVSGPSAEEILNITKSDKKMTKGQIRFILLERLGKAVFTDDVTDGELLDGIRAVLEAGV